LNTLFSKVCVNGWWIEKREWRNNVCIFLYSSLVL
jgi:hypothetical protein